MVQTDTASGAPRRRGSAVLRGLGFTVAIVLGGIAIWLIATSDTVKTQRIGALAGMWGVLIAAYAVFGARRHEADAPADPGTALELRQNAAIARSEDVASQREFQARLEALLRREVQEGVSRELAGLRSEVSALRSEILEKVGGELRMERTETTRLFGSNLEALQREVHQLKVRQLGDTGTIDAIDVPSYRVDAPLRQTLDAEEIVDAPLVPPPASSPPPATSFPPFRPLEPMRAFGARNDPVAEPHGQPVTSGPLPAFPPPNFAPPPPPAAPATAGVAVPSGPLPTMYSAPLPTMPSAPLPSAPLPSAPLPSVPPPAPVAPPEAPAAATLTPTPVSAPYAAPTPAFVSAEPPPVPPAPPVSAPAVSPPAVSMPAVSMPESTPAPGGDDPFASMPRIRPFTDFELDAVERPPAVWRPEPAAAAAASRLSGRHANTAPPPPESSGGRRRRADDSENDVLARILEREKSGPSTGEDD